MFPSLLPHHLSLKLYCNLFLASLRGVPQSGTTRQSRCFRWNARLLRFAHNDTLMSVIHSLVILLWCSVAALAGTLEVSFLNVGQGDAICIRTSAGKTILIDGGAEIAGKNGLVRDAGDTVILPFLAQHGIKTIDAMIASHSHPDHVRGLCSVVERLPVSFFIESGYSRDEDTDYRHLRDLMALRRVPRREVSAGQNIDSGDPEITIDVLHPAAKANYEKTNNHSLVLRLTHGKVRFLFTGDIELEGEADLVKRYGSELSCTVLKVPHHGAYTSSSRGLVHNARPRFAVISCGLENPFGHPHSGILARYRAAGCLILRTDYDGTITLESDGVNVTEKKPAP